jgi:isopentenyl diphosphate isomerase/L-lactate dehydrogenase-like FMN-dependent dehydrogenase
MDSKVDSQTLSIKALIPSNSWKSSDIAYIKANTKKPVVVKGIMCVEDVVTAVQLGADAIWVSNNGGRSMDTLPSTVSILKGITQSAKKTNPKVEVYIDGGIRRGTDVAKCLALGASICFLGKPVAWGLHFAGKEGLE